MKRGGRGEGKLECNPVALCVEEEEEEEEKEEEEEEKEEKKEKDEEKKVEGVAAAGGGSLCPFSSSFLSFSYFSFSLSLSSFFSSCFLFLLHYCPPHHFILFLSTNPPLTPCFSSSPQSWKR